MFDLEKCRRWAGKRPTIYMLSATGLPPRPSETNLLGVLHEALDEIERLRAELLCASEEAKKWRGLAEAAQTLVKLEDRSAARAAQLGLGA